MSEDEELRILSRLCENGNSNKEVVVHWHNVSTPTQNTSFTTLATSSTHPESIMKFVSVDKHNPACRGYDMETFSEIPDGSNKMTVSTLHPVFYGYRTDKTMTASRAAAKSRSFNIDLTPRVILAAGSYVDIIRSSGVGQYLEFKSVEKLFYLVEGAANTSPQLLAVPCSKPDIFNSDLLNVLEKRALMKLIQFAVDYARQVQGTEVTRLNENELAEGRALLRPQNKEAVTEATGHKAEVFEHLASKSFVHFMTETGVPARLQRIVLHALCLHPANTILCPAAFELLFRHINATGRYGNTAFLTPVYGSCEFPQAFCRMSAVWGGTFMLRQGISKQLLLEKESKTKVLAMQLSDGMLVSCDHVVCGAEDALSLYAEMPSPTQRNSSKSCCGSIPLSDSPNRLIARRHSVCRGSVMPDAPCVAVIPPYTADINNPYTIYASQSDHSTVATPAGCSLLQLITIIDREDEAIAADILQRAMQLLISTSKVETHELHYKTLACKHTVPVDHSALPENVFVCQDQCDELLYIEQAVKQAECIFRKMYPDEEFMAQRVAEGVARSGSGDEEDLESLSAALESFEKNA